MNYKPSYGDKQREKQKRRKEESRNQDVPTENTSDQPPSPHENAGAARVRADAPKSGKQ